MSSLELREKTDAPSKLEPQPKTAATDVTLRMSSMRAGVIDVGSNTVRLLVAASDGRGLNTILNERTHVGLAADIERTATISEEKLAQAGEVAAHYAACGRRCGAERLEIVVTAPGRQSSNAEDLRRILADATGLTVRQLSAEEEGRLAYAGAVVTSRSIPEAIGVIDIGGGSTQLLVGTAEGPSWQHCLDLGSLRLTERYVREDPPAPSELAALIDAVKRLFDPITPPIPHSVLATGGTARSLRRITGRRSSVLAYSLPGQSSWPRRSAGWGSGWKPRGAACAKARCSACWTMLPRPRPRFPRPSSRRRWSAGRSRGRPRSPSRLRVCRCPDRPRPRGSSSLRPSARGRSARSCS